MVPVEILECTCNLVIVATGPGHDSMFICHVNSHLASCDNYPLLLYIRLRVHELEVGMLLSHCCQFTSLL